VTASSDGHEIAYVSNETGRNERAASCANYCARVTLRGA
jgi:hypothetical protein